jgi:hypothetical protein
MATPANVFGSLSGAAYNSSGTITGSNPSNFTQTPKPGFGGRTGINSNQPTYVYDPYSQANANQSTKTGFTHTAAPPIAPVAWARYRDLYKQMPQETYLDNVGGPASVAPAVVGQPATK